MKVHNKGDQVVISLDLNEGGGDFRSEVQDLRLALVLASSTQAKPWIDTQAADFAVALYDAIIAAETPTFDPKGQIRCTVDARCKWTGKTAKRAGVHAVDREDLQTRGHLAQF